MSCGASLLGASLAVGQERAEESAATWYSAGVAAERRNDDVEARIAYARALELDPDHGFALINLGLMYVRGGANLQKGRTLCGRALELDPSAAKGHYCLGLAHRNDPARAMKHLETAAELDAAEPAPWVEIGHLYRLADRYDLAVAAYEKAVAAQPEKANLYIHLGYAHDQAGDLGAAKQAYEKALALDATNFLANLNLGWVLVRLGQFDLAVVRYRTAAKKRPDHPDPHFNLGNLHRRRNDFAAARAAYEAAIERAPRDPSLRVELARTFWRLGRPAEAAQALTAARALDPKPELLDQVRRVQNQLKKKPPRLVKSDPKPFTAPSVKDEVDGVVGPASAASVENPARPIRRRPPPFGLGPAR